MIDLGFQTPSQEEDDYNTKRIDNKECFSKTNRKRQCQHKMRITKNNNTHVQQASYNQHVQKIQPPMKTTRYTKNRI